MAITPRYSWPLPDLPDAPNVPFDMNALAVGIEGSVGAIQDLWTQLGISGYRIEVGSRVSTTNPSGQLNVPFLVVFGATPVVVASHGDTGGAGKPLYAIGTDPSGVLFGAQWAAGIVVRVNYVAIGPAPAALGREGVEPSPFITYHMDPDPEVS